jgi:hypothetical protein
VLVCNLNGLSFDDARIFKQGSRSRVATKMINAIARRQALTMLAPSELTCNKQEATAMCPPVHLGRFHEKVLAVGAMVNNLI